MKLFAALSTPLSAPLSAALLLTLAACGQRGPLHPAEGQALPPVPLHAARAPTADQLLTVPDEYRPLRLDEPLTRSERRPADPFALPPTDPGGAGPANSSQSEPDDRPRAGGETPQ